LVEVENQNENEFITSLAATGFGKRRLMRSNRLDLDCPASWTKHENQCFKFIDSPVKDWNLAQTICRNQASSLAAIKSQEENEYLFNFGEEIFFFQF